MLTLLAADIDIRRDSTEGIVPAKKKQEGMEGSEKRSSLIGQLIEIIIKEDSQSCRQRIQQRRTHIMTSSTGFDKKGTQQIP